MPVRRRHRVGDYLVRDDITGTNIYASQATRDYLGRLTKTSRADPVQPQLYARPVNDPQAVPIYSPDTGIPPANLAWSPTIGDTDVPTPSDGAAAHLFDVGIGQMIVGSTFIVR
jgi:hypothetical protein